MDQAQNRRWMARSAHLARARTGLRVLLRLTDRGGWVAPGLLGCAYPRTERALAALSDSGVRLLVNLHERPMTRPASNDTASGRCTCP